MAAGSNVRCLRDSREAGSGVQSEIVHGVSGGRRTAGGSRRTPSLSEFRGGMIAKPRAEADKGIEFAPG